MSLLGIDIGTSGCKATLIDYEGNIKGQAYKEYSLISPNPGWQELNPNTVWESVKEVIAGAIFGHKGESIKALSVSSLGEAVIPIDSDGNALCNSIMYIDIRGQKEAKYLEDKMGHEKILKISGTSVHPMYGINKIMWLKKNMPEIYKNTWMFLLFADFILFKLGAEAHTDYSLAARTMAFDVVNKEWSSEILNNAGIEEDKFGKPVQAGTIVGEISMAIAKELRLPMDLILVAGGHDQPCAALGAGVIKSDMAVDGLGTAECITPAFDRPVISELMARSSFACVPHVKKNMYVTYAFNITSGSMMKWFRDNFGHKYIEEAEKLNMNIYDVMILKAIKKPSSIFVLPHFAGSGTPYLDTESKGAIIGLSINTKAEDIIMGILEGITYEMMVNIDKLEEAGVQVNELRTVGGLAKSELFLQLKSNIMGKKVTTLKISEAGTLGVAILAGTASGIYKNLEDAVEKLVKKEKEFYPDLKTHEKYLEKFENYKRIYPAVKSIFQ